MVPLHPQRVPGRPDRLRWIVPAGTLTVTGPLADVPAPLAALLADGTLARVTAEPAAVVTVLGADREWSREGARVRTALHAALDNPAGWTAATGPGAPGADGRRAQVRTLDDRPVGTRAANTPALEGRWPEGRCSEGRCSNGGCSDDRCTDDRCTDDRGVDDRDTDDALLHAAAQEVLAGPAGDFARSHGGSIELVGVRDGVVTVRLGGACHGCPASWFTLHQRLERRLRRLHPGLREVRATGGPARSGRAAPAPAPAPGAGNSRAGRSPWTF
ncbi:NifU family protein [Streptomyces sp. NPDC004065]|uniref:NifU family protein n=1 Tax=Streptomyces sp. NPDC004065 TaxID=3364689 RepID=UPI003850A856